MEIGVVHGFPDVAPNVGHQYFLYDPLPIYLKDAKIKGFITVDVNLDSLVDSDGFEERVSRSQEKIVREITV
jgi:hypothetical protein